MPKSADTIFPCVQNCVVSLRIYVLCMHIYVMTEAGPKPRVADQDQTVFFGRIRIRFLKLGRIRIRFMKLGRIRIRSDHPSKIDFFAAFFQNINFFHLYFERKK